MAAALTATTITPVYAFGDLSCRGIEACNATVCTLAPRDFDITFDWSNTTAMVFDDDNRQEMIGAVGLSEAAGQLLFISPGDPDVEFHQLGIAYDSRRITATYSISTPRAYRVYTAACDHPEDV